MTGAGAGGGGSAVVPRGAGGGGSAPWRRDWYPLQRKSRDGLSDRRERGALHCDVLNSRFQALDLKP